MAAGLIGTAAREAIPALTEALSKATKRDRVVAAEALAYVDPHNQTAIATLAEMAGDHDPGLRQLAVMALGRLGSEAQAALPALARTLRSANANLRLEGAMAWAYVGGDAIPVLPVLLEVALERSHASRARVVEAVAHLHSGGEAAVPTLTRVLWEDGPAQVKAAEVLGRIGPPAKSAVSALTTLLKGSDTEVRIQAALALWKIDHRAGDSVPVLVAELKTPAPLRQASGLPSPGRFGAPLSSPAAPPCRQAAEALAEMGPAAHAAVPALLEVLKSPAIGFRQALLRLGAVEDRSPGGRASSTGAHRSTRRERAGAFPLRLGRRGPSQTDCCGSGTAWKGSSGRPSCAGESFAGCGRWCSATGGQGTGGYRRPGSGSRAVSAEGPDGPGRGCSV